MKIFYKFTDDYNAFLNRMSTPLVGFLKKDFSVGTDGDKGVRDLVPGVAGHWGQSICPAGDWDKCSDPKTLSKVFPQFYVFARFFAG